MGVKWHNEGDGAAEDRTLQGTGPHPGRTERKGSVPAACTREGLCSCFSHIFFCLPSSVRGQFCTKHPPVQTGSHHPLLSCPLCLTKACQGAVCKTAAGHAELCPSAELLFPFFPYKHHLKTHHPATCIFTFFQERPSMWSRKCLHECSLK